MGTFEAINAENKNLKIRKPQKPWVSEMQNEKTQKRTEQTSRIQRLTLTVSASCPKSNWTHPFVKVNTEPTQIANCASDMPSDACMFVFVSLLPPDTRYAGT